jgi:WD40 repeat protein
VGTVGKLICTGSDDASLIVWNPKTCESIHIVKGHPYHTEGLTCLDINSNSSLAISGSKDGSVHIVNIVTGKVRPLLYCCYQAFTGLFYDLYHFNKQVGASHIYLTYHLTFS